MNSRVFAACCCVLAMSLALAPGVDAGSLRGTTSSLNRQNTQARDHDYTFLRTKSQVSHFVNRGWLVPVRPNGVYTLKGVSFPYSRPEVRLFVERLGAQYHAACGEKLVVTSLTRPKNYQPSNASPRSVHPTGMALDLRRPRSRSCRSWLERVLLSLEDQRVLEATYERWPPHYHVAVFPQPYKRYVERLQAAGADRTYRVGRGDTLWTIAKKYGVSVSRVKEHNRLRSSRIYPGQVLKLPAGR